MRQRMRLLMLTLFLLPACADPGGSGAKLCGGGQTVSLGGQTICLLLGTALPDAVGNPAAGLMITETGAMPLPWYETKPPSPAQQAACADVGKPYAQTVWRGVVCSDDPTLATVAKQAAVKKTLEETSTDTISAQQISDWATNCAAYCGEAACPVPQGLSGDACVDACFYGTAEVAVEHGLACADAASTLRGCLAAAQCAASACDATALVQACPFAAGAGAAPKAELSDSALAFEGVAVGASAEKTITLSNTGTAALVVTSLQVDGSAAFSAGLSGTTVAAGAAVSLDPALTVPAGGSVAIAIRFAPTSEGTVTATLRLVTNDPDQPAASVALTGTPAAAALCLKADPATLDFGVVPVGATKSLTVTVSTCGSAAVTVQTVALENVDAPSPFALGPVTSPPVVLEPGAALTVVVTYAPQVAADNTGTLRLTWGAPEDEQVLSIAITGASPAPDDCPKAVIQITEGTTVLPQTQLHLDGSTSTAPAGGITSYEWTVEAPTGSASLLQPSHTAPAPTLVANVAGTYVFRLTVRDENGTASCEPGLATVLVVPEARLHVELLWDTPGDPDPTDQGPDAGADLDLHLLHPSATAGAQSVDTDGDATPDGWNDATFDCYYLNTHPQWTANAEDPGNPSLDRDDTDGAGPENINLADPESGVTYRLGVYVWSDHGYGPSTPTVRIYVDGALAYEKVGPPMESQDFWEVGSLAFPGGTFAALLDGDAPIVVTMPLPVP